MKIFDKLPEAIKNNFTTITSMPYLIELLPLDSDKSTAFKILSDYINKDGITYSIGDGLNDLTLLKSTDHSIAMDNAYDIVKELATFITLSNDDNGVMYAFENYILK